MAGTVLLWTDAVTSPTAKVIDFTHGVPPIQVRPSLDPNLAPRTAAGSEYSGKVEVPSKHVGVPLARSGV
jgi:hypothetical protein